MTTPWESKGLTRLVRAAGHSSAGVLHGLTQDSAIRQVVIGHLIPIPLIFFLGVSRVESLLLVLSLMLVVFAEFINSAIERAVDHTSLAEHPLAKQSKDLASAAVGITVLMAGLSWTVIAGPVILRWCGISL